MIDSRPGYPPATGVIAEVPSTLLCESSPRTSTNCWSPLNDVPVSKSCRAIVFTDSNLMLQAAADGQGVALARSVLAAGDLLGGRLVRPFEWSIPARYHYFLVYPAAHEARAEVRAFREFLLAEVTRRLPQARRPRKPIRSKGSSTARAVP